MVPVHPEPPTLARPPALSVTPLRPEGRSFGGAIVSDDGLYRYRLWRRWDAECPTMVWIMLNPSTADAEVDDPTIRRCIGFARREHCGGIEVVNLYALRATNPAAHPTPEGPENAKAIGPDAQAILIGLVADGSTIGNVRLRSQLGLAPERYSELTWNLKDHGLAIAGRGRAGSLALTVKGQTLSWLGTSACSHPRSRTTLSYPRSRTTGRAKRRRRQHDPETHRRDARRRS